MTIYQNVFDFSNDVVSLGSKYLIVIRGKLSSRGLYVYSSYRQYMYTY